MNIIDSIDTDFHSVKTIIQINSQIRRIYDSKNCDSFIPLTATNAFFIILLFECYYSACRVLFERYVSILPNSVQVDDLLSIPAPSTHLRKLRN